jgi:hypothetical protein
MWPAHAASRASSTRRLASVSRVWSSAGCWTSSTPSMEQHRRPFAPRLPATLAASSALDEARPLAEARPRPSATVRARQRRPYSARRWLATRPRVVALGDRARWGDLRSHADPRREHDGRRSSRRGPSRRRAQAPERRLRGVPSAFDAPVAERALPAGDVEHADVSIAAIGVQTRHPLPGGRGAPAARGELARALVRGSGLVSTAQSDQRLPEE